MQKEEQRFLELTCKKFKRERTEIFDIIADRALFAEIGNNTDSKITVIINGEIEEGLKASEELGLILKNKIENIEVESIAIEELFEKGCSKLLVYGISLTRGKSLARILGFSAYTIFSYKLKKLDHNKKTQFTYAISGRNGIGVLESLKGISLGRGAVQVPIENSAEFETFLQRWDVEYKRKDMLEAVSKNG